MYTILITGGCGFIGSNIAISLKSKYPAYRIICIDNLKRRGSELNITRLMENGIKFIHGDIRNKEDLEIDEKSDFIIDAAAEPSVMAGIGSGANYVINTNLNGTINVLNLAVRDKAKFIFLSTSRVYPITYLQQINYTESNTRFELSKKQNLTGISIKGINEKFPLDKARSLYGTTKLASELLIEEFKEFFGVGCVINRCGVIAGPYQMGKVDQGVVTLWLARHYWKRDITYFGFGRQGKQVRDVLHILDLFDLIDFEIQNFDSVQGQTFNVGGGEESNISLKELTTICAEVSGNRVKENSTGDDRRGDIPVYITDNTKISRFTHWQPKRKVLNIVSDTFDWIHENENHLCQILNV